MADMISYKKYENPKYMKVHHFIPTGRYASIGVQLKTKVVVKSKKSLVRILKPILTTLAVINLIYLNIISLYYIHNQLLKEDTQLIEKQEGKLKDMGAVIDSLIQINLDMTKKIEHLYDNFRQVDLLFDNLTNGNESQDEYDVLSITDEMNSDSRRRKRGVDKPRGRSRGHNRSAKPSRRTLDTSTTFTAIQLKGAIPEGSILEQGILGPWIMEEMANKNVGNLVLFENNEKILIEKEGLYFIYAQVYYYKEDNIGLGANGYAIKSMDKDQKESLLAICTTDMASPGDTESSCYTSLMRTLKAGDQVYLKQRDKNRRVIFYPEYTYFGLVLING